MAANTNTGAAEEGTGPFTGLTTADLVESLADAYDQMPMPVGQYVLIVLIPAGLFALMMGVAAVLLPFPAVVRLPMALLGLLAVGTALIYPKLVLEQRKREIEKRFHLLVTHMTVLATTNIDRVEVFRTLAAEEEYGELAEEIGRVVQLVDTWNQSLDDACRRRAKRSPSKPFGDFLDRLAYSLGAGQELSDFLLGEQEVLIQNYVTIYQGALDNLEVMKDLYLSMVLSMTFALVFAVVLPILTGNNPMVTVSAVIVLFVFVQLGFFMAIRTLTPYDPVWYYPSEMEPPTERRLQVGMAVGVGLTALGLLVTAGDLMGVGPVGVSDFVPLDPMPLALYVAIPLTPLALPGLLLRLEEKKINARDKEFPSFIRALGASESTKQSTTSKVLSTLRTKDFGPLTPDVNNLYKRLNMRIDAPRAWRHFATDTRSYLIQKGSEMYLVGRQMGGDPKQLGELISKNLNEVLQLRERRHQATITLIGLLYGITAASTFAFFIGLKIVEVLSDMSLDLNAESLEFGQLVYTNVYDIPTIEFLLVGLILFNALLSSLMIRTVDGGNKTNSYLHFVALTWLSSVVAIATKAILEGLLNV